MSLSGSSLAVVEGEEGRLWFARARRRQTATMAAVEREREREG